MRSSKKGLRGRSRRPGVYARPVIESLEDRRLLAIDVTNLGFDSFGLGDSFQLEGDLLASKVSESSEQTDLTDVPGTRPSAEG